MTSFDRLCVQLSHHTTDHEHDERFPLHPRQLAVEKYVHEDASAENFEVVHDLESRRTEVPNDVKHTVVAHEITERRGGVRRETANSEAQSCLRLSSRDAFAPEQS